MNQVKLGIFGVWRGAAFVSIINSLENAKLVAICDKDEDRLKAVAARCPEDIKLCRDFDELVSCGIDGILICNYFPEHAEYAIRAMEKGIHVFSECTSAVTLKDCVRLCECVEKTGCKYMLAENYPFTAAMLEFERLQKEGTLGRILYAEGEYNHTGTREELESLTPFKYHWRAWMPRTYYLTHSLGPLMYATKQMPVQVSAFAVHSDVLEQYTDFRHNDDAFAMMNCMTDGGALFRFTGCAHMGSASGYRLAGEYGSCETGRTLGENVNVTYHSWCIPEGKDATKTYMPTFAEHADLASGAGHGGGDFWTVYNFVEYILHDVEPFFNVYRGCCMSAVAILAWRSCLENGKTYAIPDFRNKQERDLYRDDDLTPFPTEDRPATLPPSTMAAKKMAEA